MITIQITEQEASVMVKALQKHKTRKQKSANRWMLKKEVGLIVPLEVADHFIQIDTHTAQLITPIIERIEYGLVN